MKEEMFEVRDHRNKSMFRVDDEYLNGYAKLCGVNATLVYLCLCRHADRNQESFPSVQLMAEKTAISRDSVMRGIKKLIEWNIISKQRERKKDAKWLNNRYVLLDKSIWKSKPSGSQQHGSESDSQVANQAEPSRSQRESQVAHSDTKVSHIKDTHIKSEGIVANATKEFNFEEKLEKLKNGERKEYKVIALYWYKKGWKFENEAQYQSEFKRQIRPAKALIGYSGKQVGISMNYCMEKYPEIWTLETVLKTIMKATQG